MPAEIDTANASGVTDLLAAVAAQSPQAITADMTATKFCDSAGARALVRAHKMAAAGGAELRLALGDSPATRIIHLIGLDQIIPLYRDVEHSLAPLNATGPTAGQLHSPLLAKSRQVVACSG